MARKSIPGKLAFEDAFALTPNDSNDIITHAGNTQGYASCYVHNPSTGGSVKVTPAASVDGTAVTVYIAQGATCPLAVKRVWATPAPPASMIGMVSLQNKS